MFKLFPYLSYEMETVHKKKCILERFSSSVNILKSLSVTKSKYKHGYEGLLSTDGCKFRRSLITGYSAFLPILSCSLHEEKDKLRVKIKIHFHKKVNIALVLFFLFQIPLFSLDILSVFMLLVPYLIIIYLFNVEAQILRVKLIDFIK